MLGRRSMRRGYRTALVEGVGRAWGVGDLDLVAVAGLRGRCSGLASKPCVGAGAAAVAAASASEVTLGNVADAQGGDVGA